MKVRASGGLVFRTGAGGPEIILIHRPRYDDWSLPKGKNDPGETPEQAAVREVAEETGLDPVIISDLGHVAYTTSNGVDKAVTYFLMRAVGEVPWTPNEEVDELRWLPVPEALPVLSYEHDRALVAGCDLETHLQSGMLYLIRHGSAGNRMTWNADDRIRPLTKKGRRQAEAVAAWLGTESMDAILSSEYLRCTETVDPLGNRTGIPVRTHPALAEGAEDHDIIEFAVSLKGLNAVICSHGDVIPDMLELMAMRGMEFLSDIRCQKGSTWIVSVANGRFDTARYVPPVTS